MTDEEKKELKEIILETINATREADSGFYKINPEKIQ